MPWDLKVQYEGILNGEELKKYLKKLESEPWLSRNQNIKPPQELHGLKIGFIKSVSFWKCRTVYHVGIKSRGLKKIHNLMDLKPILKPMTKEVLEEVFDDLGKFRVEIQEDRVVLFRREVKEYIIYRNSARYCPKWIIDRFHKHHVDYQGLIE